MDNIISLDEFIAKCIRREYYVGYVMDLGYVSGWRIERLLVDRPPNNPYAFVGDAQFSQIVNIPVIIYMPVPSAQNNNQNSNIYTEKGRIAGWGGIAATAGTIVDKAILMEPKYLRVNPQGTLIKNPKFGQAKVGTKMVGGKLGWGFFVLSAISDIKAAGNNEVTPGEAFIDIAINGVITRIGCINPLVGVILGLLYMGFTSRPPNIRYRSYEEIHGSITPADNTRVNIPIRDMPRPCGPRVIQVREQPVLKQGRR
jgi:hypothetical protein